MRARGFLAFCLDSPTVSETTIGGSSWHAFLQNWSHPCRLLGQQCGMPDYCNWAYLPRGITEVSVPVARDAACSPSPPKSVYGRTWVKLYLPADREELLSEKYQSRVTRGLFKQSYDKVSFSSCHAEFSDAESEA